MLHKKPKYSALLLSPSTESRELKKQWESLQYSFQNNQKHGEFLLRCFKLNNLHWAYEHYYKWLEATSHPKARQALSQIRHLAEIKLSNATQRGVQERPFEYAQPRNTACNYAIWVWYQVALFLAGANIMTGFILEQKPLVLLGLLVIAMPVKKPQIRAA